MVCQLLSFCPAAKFLAKITFFCYLSLSLTFEQDLQRILRKTTQVFQRILLQDLFLFWPNHPAHQMLAIIWPQAKNNDLQKCQPERRGGRRGGGGRPVPNTRFGNIADLPEIVRLPAHICAYQNIQLLLDMCLYIRIKNL